MTEVRELQERAARGMPAEVVRVVDGWWLRHVPGPAWWAGSVLPHSDDADGELDRRIDGAAAFCAGRGVRTRFQITPGACPDALDGLLAGRGYRADCPVSLRTADTAAVRAVADRAGVRITGAADDEWFGCWHRVHGGDAGPERARLDRVTGRSGYAGLRDGGGELIAVGRVVLDTGWAGVFGMATVPAARGRGAARAILAALAGWAADRGAARAYLQVAEDNPGALRLYAGSGFTERARYHYRVAPQTA